MKLIIGLLIAVFFAVFTAVSIYLVIILAGNKLLAENESRLTMDQATLIYDVNGQEVTSVYKQNRELVTYNELPKRLIWAFIAVEDKRFLEHTGFDVRAVLRALYRDIISRSAKEGGSTITQQLAKNMFLSSDKTLFRKVRELSLAMALENQKTKDEIMVLYLNNIYFGNGTYGVKTAAKRFFNKSNLEELELWEMATLAAIPKAPTHYSPLNNPEKSKERRNVVLRLMADQQYITPDELAAAKQMEYDATIHQAPQQTSYLTYVDYVLDEVEQRFGVTDEELLRNGFKIYTNMDRIAQKSLEEVFADSKPFPKDGPEQKVQGAMVILNQKTGGIAAMIGGRDYVAKGLNRSLARRQPGSAFKPIVSFATALEAGHNPYDKIIDEPMSFGADNYTPKNYDNKYRGEVDMFEAMKFSINIPAVKLLDQYGVATGVKFAEKLKIELTPDDRNLSIALGGLTKGVSPLEMARAYSAFANYGELLDSHTVTKIVDSMGTEVYSFAPKKTRVMKESTAFHITRLLQGVVDGGTGKAAKMNRPVAGKTGTTQVNVPGITKGNRDAWFVGYTPEYTAAVWIGFDKTDKRHYLKVSSGAAAKIFKEVMTKTLRARQVTGFMPPPEAFDIDKYKKPPAAVGLSGYATRDRKISLEWRSDEAGLNYRIYRLDPGESEFVVIQEGSDLSFFDLEVTPGATYQYYIEVIRPETSVVGDRSNVLTITMPTEDEYASMEYEEVESEVTDVGPEAEPPPLVPNAPPPITTPMVEPN
jgi:penicillin-binding protein 2A